MSTSSLQRASAMAFIAETTEGTLKSPTAATNFVPLKSGFSMSSEVESLTSDELVNDIGLSKGLVGKENPQGSHPAYLKHSEVEGQEPNYGILIYSCLGSKTVNATQYSTASSSSAGSSSARAYLKMGSNEEDNYVIGQGLLIKDATNGYSIRNVYEVNSGSNQLDLNFNLSSAPASGVGLGKAVLYKPAASGHPSFSAWHYIANGSGIQAIAGCKTSSMSIDATAGQQLEATFAYAGSAYYFNPIEITSSSKYIDFTDDVGTVVATLTEGIYKSPEALADEIASKMTAASAASGGDTISCSFYSYGANAGKFLISSSSTPFSLLWSSGSNTANSAKTKLGFSNSNDTGSASYTSDSAISYAAPYTPDYDDATNIVVKSNELFIGSFSDNVCRAASTLNFTIDTPSTDVDSICASSGILEKLTLSREVTMTATLVLKAHEVGLFDKFINNTVCPVMANFGPKDGSGNWIPGKCVNIYMANATISGHVVGGDDIVTLEITAKGYVDSTRKDVYINFL